MSRHGNLWLIQAEVSVDARSLDAALFYKQRNQSQAANLSQRIRLIRYHFDEFTGVPSSDCLGLKPAGTIHMLIAHTPRPSTGKPICSVYVTLMQWVMKVSWSPPLKLRSKLKTVSAPRSKIAEFLNCGSPSFSRKAVEIQAWQFLHPEHPSSPRI